MDNSKKLSFNKRLLLSIKDIDKYNIIGIGTIGNSLKYILLLLVCFSAILSVCITFRAADKIQKASEFLKENVPEFEIKDNRFSIESEEPIEIESRKNLKLKIILDNADDETKYSSEIENYDGNIVILLKDKIIMRYTSGIVTEEQYNDLKEYYNMDTINKDAVLEKVNGDGKQEIYFTILLIAFVVSFIINFVSTIINVLALSVLGIIISKMAGTSLKYSSIFNMSISAITLPTILSLIYVLLELFAGFTMQYFQIMYTLVSYIYLIAAILIIRSDTNKKKKEIVATIQITNLEKEKKNKEKQEKKEEKQENKNQDENKNQKEKNNNEKQQGKTKKNKVPKEPTDTPTPQENIE